jgi:hypothetical protein
MVGISTLEALRARDTYSLFRELKDRDPRMSLNFLYAILAAQERGDWREIQRTRKAEILLRLDEMGLTPRRTNARRKNYN